MLAADSGVSQPALSEAAESAVSEAAESGVGGSRGTPSVALRRARLATGTPLRPRLRPRARALVLVRPRAPLRRRVDQEPTVELDGLVERSHLFTADPEAASAGKLYRQLALYPSEPSAPSADSAQQGLDEESYPEFGTEDALIEEELLLNDGDFGRRLQPGKQSTALPAYPPYSHGPLAVPIEPYRSPEYGPVSGEARQGASAAPETRQTIRPVSRETALPTTVPPARPTAAPSPRLEPESAGVPLQGAEEEPPAPVTEKVVVQQPEPVRYPARRPTPRRPYLPKAPAHYGAPVRPKPLKAPRRPQKVAAPSLYKPGAVYYAQSDVYNDRLNEIHSEPLWSTHAPVRHTPEPLPSLPVYLPSRLHPDRPEVVPGHQVGSGHRGVGGDRYYPAEYRHYTGHRQAKKSGGFGRPRPVPHRYEPEAADVSYGARTGNDGAFEWFSDYPVGSSHR